MIITYADKTFGTSTNTVILNPFIQEWGYYCSGNNSLKQNANKSARLGNTPNKPSFTGDLVIVLYDQY